MGRKPIKHEESQDPHVKIEVDETIKGKKEVVIIGITPNLEEDKEYIVSGSTAFNLIQKGYAKLK